MGASQFIESIAQQSPAAIMADTVLPETMESVNWHLYIILCSDDSLYTGITTDVERRLRQHAGGKGAKYFRGRQPRRLLYLESGHTRSTAGKREIEIKSMKRDEKDLLVLSPRNEIKNQ